MSEGGRLKNLPVTYDVLVRNLPLDVREEEIREVFNRFGTISSVYWKDDIHRENTKFGYVRFPNESDANSVLKDQSAMMLRGNKLQLSRGRKEKKDASGARGGASDGFDGNTKSWNSNSGQANKQWQTNSTQNKPDVVSFNQPDRSVGAGGDLVPDSKNIEMMFVCTVESPCVFWAQAHEDLENVAFISDSLLSLCPSASPIQGKPQRGKVYATQFSEDGLWYRCRVESYQGDSQSEVLYVDYGNSEVVSNSAIRELPPRTANGKPNAKKCILYGLDSAYTKEELGFQQGIDRLKTLIDQKLVKVSIGKKILDMTCVLVEINGVDVNQAMLSEGFAIRRTPKNVREQSLGGSGSSYSGKENEGQRQNNRGQTDSNQGYNTNFQNNPRQGLDSSRLSALLAASQHGRQCGKGNFKITGNTPNNPPIPMSSMFDGPPSNFPGHHPIQQEAPTIDMWDSTSAAQSCSAAPVVPMPMFPTMVRLTGPPPTAPLDQAQIQAELQESLREVMRLRNELATRQQEKSYIEEERNAVVLEHAKLKGELRNMTQDWDNMKQQLQDMSLSQRLRSLLVNVNKIKDLRKQFPTERQARDNIEWAIDLVKSNSEQISANNLEITRTVKLAMDAYNTAQDDIRSCADMSTLEALIGARDVARKDLFLVLVEFEEAVCKIPLQDKQKHLGEAVQSLELTHSAFLRPEITDALKLSDALDWYAAWKMKKTAEFRERRALTNACHNSLNGSLNILQQELALDVESTGESPVSVANLDEPLKKYQSAVHNEIMATDIERSDESSFVTLVVKTLVGEIHSELKEIDNLVKLQLEYGSLTEKIRKWLDQKPNVSQLHKLRKTTKTLKSKLRHKLADKLDQEESDEVDKEEISEIELELTVIRSELQTALGEEDKLLVELADMNENHFPELSLQYPDLGIDNEIEYGGLVKVSRSLEYFDTCPLPDCDKRSIMKSSFCNNPVVLKEFIVDDSLGVRKSDFLRRAMAYHNITHPNILPLEAIFFANGKRNSYIQLPYHTENVHKLTGKESMSEQALYDILRGTLEGLRCLHEAKLVHGSVHPQNVFIDGHGKGILAEFDFTKSLQHRAEQEYITQNDLRFIAPEVSMNKSVSRASDIYNFGLLTLWLVKPSAPILVRSCGVPSLENIQFQNASIAALIQTTLIEKPSARPTATELLLFPYFINKPDDNQSCTQLTLQLRPKQPSPPSCDRSHGGILKNSPSSTPPPQDIPPQPALVPTSVSTPDHEVAQIFTQTLDAIPDIVHDASGTQTQYNPDTSLDEAPPLNPISDDEASFTSTDDNDGTSAQDMVADIEQERTEEQASDNAAAPTIDKEAVTGGTLGIPVADIEEERTEDCEEQASDNAAAPTVDKEAVTGGTLGIPDINIQCPSPQPADVPLPVETADELDIDGPAEDKGSTDSSSAKQETESTSTEGQIGSD